MTDWFNVYKENKLKNLLNFITYTSKLLTLDEKNILTKNQEEILKEITNIHLNKNYIKTPNKKEYINLFIESDYITNFNLENEISTIIDYFINENIIFDIKENEKDVIYLAVLLKITFRVDTLTNPFLKENPNINNIVMEYINFYTKIKYIFINEEGKNITKDLLNEIKKVRENQIKFFNTWNNLNSFNKYIRINEDKAYYLSQYNYYISDLEKYDPKPIKSIYETSTIEDNFTNIGLELTLITLLKEIAASKVPSTYLMPVKKRYLENKNNINELKKISNNKIKLLINYSDLDDNLEDNLIRNNINYFIYCSKNSDILEFKDDKNYLLSKEFMKLHQVKIKPNMILETINVFMKDTDILYLKNKGE